MEKRELVCLYYKIDFKTKMAIKCREGYYIMIKGSIQQEDKAFINIYAPNMGAPKYVKQVLTLHGDRWQLYLLW